MSWHFVVANINRALEQIVNWYREFMDKTEKSFVALHQRVLYLEQRQAWQGPSDEQVERVLRKILAEKFAGVESQRVDNENTMRDGDYFVKNPRADFTIPRALPVDIATITVDPAAVPSREYAETLEMLDNKLSSFPYGGRSNLSENGLSQDAKDHPIGFERPKQSTYN